MKIPEGYKYRDQKQPMWWLLPIAIWAIVLILLYSIATANAADTGWLQGSSFVSSQSDCTEVGTAWTNPSNAQSSDNSKASGSSGLLRPFSQCLLVTGFNAGIPSGSTIDGVEARSEVSRASTGSGTVSYSTVELLLAGTASGNNNSNGSGWNTTDTVTTWGSPTDTWGLSLTDSDVNNSGFGFEVGNHWVGASGNRSTFIDDMEIKVYYTPPASSGTIDQTPLWLKAWINTAYASTTCQVITQTTSGAQNSTSSITCQDTPTTTPIINTTQDINNGLILFLATFFGLIFYFKMKGGD